MQINEQRTKVSLTKLLKPSVLSSFVHFNVFLLLLLLLLHLSQLQLVSLCRISPSGIFPLHPEM